MSDGVTLVRSVAALIEKPFGVLTHFRARFLIIKFKGLMPQLAVTVSDPVSAIVVSALDFLTAAIETQVGQQILSEVNQEVVNLIKFVHSKLPALPTPSVKPAA